MGRGAECFLILLQEGRGCFSGQSSAVREDLEVPWQVEGLDAGVDGLGWAGRLGRAWAVAATFASTCWLGSTYEPKLSERSKANAYPMIISDRSEKELTRMHSKVNPQIRKSSQSKTPHGRPDRYAINTTRAERIF